MTLHQRHTYSSCAKAMAHRILDEARAGLNVSAQRIDWALRVTGDLQ